MVHMPRLINARTLLDMVVIGVNAVMEDSGPKGLTLRGIARELRGSPSTLLHHYGNLDELLRLAAWETADDRIRDIEASTRSLGIAGFLPELPYDVVSARTWLGWLELARTHDGVAAAIADERAQERALIDSTLDTGLDPVVREEVINTLQALVDGLLIGLCAPHDPLSIERGRALLPAQASAVTSSAVERSASIIALGSAAE